MMAIEVWILGEIIDEGSEKESSIWNFYGVFFDRDDALRAYSHIHSKKTERYFVVPVSAGEVIWDDITKYPEMELLSQNNVC